MSKLAKALTAAAGNAGESLYVEDVFSTYLYTGTGADQTITNGIDLDGEGGLVWVKGRDTAYDHRLFDTDRGAGKMLSSNNTGAEQTLTEQLEAFNSDGFQVGTNAGINGSGSNYASWTFRKAEKFFDVVTYTGNGVAGRTVAHNLGSVPAVMIVKRLNGNNDWFFYHTDLGGTKYLKLNTTGDATTNSVIFNDTDPTSTEFTLGNDAGVNANTATYVAYLFASDAGGFGDDGSESIIKCGSYTGNGTTSNYIDFGFEPQWFLVKNATSGSTPWLMLDNMRGWPAAPAASQQELTANTSNAESTGSNVGITSTGIGITTSATAINKSGDNYIYIAIRRPMKTPESGTEVFDSIARTGTGADATITGMGFTPDTAIIKARNAAEGWPIASRMTGSTNLYTNDTSTGSTTRLQNPAWDVQEGLKVKTDNEVNGGGKTYINYFFKRATGFFDVVAYTGDGGTTQTLNHNLGVTPELMIGKRRNDTQNWVVYHSLVGAGKYYNLNTTSGASTLSTVWGGVEPTSTQFTVGNSTTVNFNGDSYISYHFATLDGVSKVGSFSHTQGTATNVDCGFSNGARFVLWKKSDGTDGWQVYDSARGINAGADPFLQLNSTDVEISEDLIDPLAAGFSVASGKTSGTYIFLAIA